MQSFKIITGPDRYFIVPTLLGTGTRRAKALYEAGDMDGLVKYLRKCRCDLVEEMHDSQRKVDRMDYLIRQTQKEADKQ